MFCFFVLVICMPYIQTAAKIDRLASTNYKITVVVFL